MHPDVKQVVPVMAEPIKNTDGAKKQDCEINAAKRLIPLLHEQFPRKGLIITGDDLFSRQPMIESVLKHHFHFFFVAKSTRHPYMMAWLAMYEQLHERRETDANGRTILYQGMKALHVNYFCKK